MISFASGLKTIYMRYTRKPIITQFITNSYLKLLRKQAEKCEHYYEEY